MAENRVVTLYRLQGVEPTLEGLFYALDGELLDEREFAPIFPEFPAGAVAYLVRGHFKIAEVDWSADLARLVGEDTSLDDKKAAALLLVAVEGKVFAIGFGQGFRLVPDELKEADFGLRFAVRAVDPDRVRDIFRRSMTRMGRQDATFVPSGLPIDSIGIRRHDEIVRRLGGELATDAFGLETGGTVTVEGAAGLRLPIPLDNVKLVAMLKQINKICATEAHPSFAFIEAIRPVRDAGLIERLDAGLDEGLRGAVDIPLGLAVPVDLIPRLAETVSYNIRIGSALLRGRPHLDLDDILSRCRVLNRSTPAAALRHGRIELSDSRDGARSIGSASAIRFIEAGLTMGARQYFLIDGEWHESGTEFLNSIRKQVDELIVANPKTVLPPWEKGEHEPHYNTRVQHELGQARYLCLDRKNVRTALHRHTGFEVCDLLGPDGELVCVKPANGSGPLSHLFNQALVAVETLFNEPEARRGFSEIVAEVSAGARTVSSGYRPRKVVFAIHLTTGRTLTSGTLFPFSQVVLVNMAATLKSHYDVEVEVIGIPLAPAR
ncbi:DUF6119 family protein [Thermopolyspora sp. NPDC052614]|uniref:TIGR04141 family sporadically distributed protein n=1 Tax=Thermopolyspora sp. NPDC052614 TaxID=3155682 RepID=UPI00344A7B6D